MIPPIAHHGLIGVTALVCLLAACGDKESPGPEDGGAVDGGAPDGGAGGDGGGPDGGGTDGGGSDGGGVDGGADGGADGGGPDGGGADGGGPDGGGPDGGGADGGGADGGGTDGGGPDGGGTDGGGTDGGGTDGGAELHGKSSVEANLYNAFSALVTVTVDRDATVRVEYGESDLDHSTPGVALTAGEPTELLVLGLRADRSYRLQALAFDDPDMAGEPAWTGDMLRFDTDPLPDDWPVCTPSFTAPETEFDPDQVICSQGVTSRSRYMYYCTDYWGEPVFSVSTEFSDSLMSMRPLMDGSWASTSYTNSKVAFFAPTGQLTAQYSALWFADDTRFTHEYIDSHELYQISSGDWAGAVAFITNSYERFDSGEYKIGNGVIVYDPATREVLYDYSFHGELGDQVAMDEKMPYERTGNGDYTEDWNHANTILHGIEESGREYLLISLKSQDWIFKLYPDTDELAWALGWDGDFRLVEDMDAEVLVEDSPLDWAYHQHGVIFVEGEDGQTHLMMLDNGYPRHDETDYVWDMYYSRIVELRLDEERMLADTVFAWGSPRPLTGEYFFSSTCGNTVLLQGGDRVMTLDGEGKTRIEVSYPEGEERWRMSCESTEWCEYRVSWFPSLYETTWIYE